MTLSYWPCLSLAAYPAVDREEGDEPKEKDGSEGKTDTMAMPTLTTTAPSRMSEEPEVKTEKSTDTATVTKDKTTTDEKTETKDDTQGSIQLPGNENQGSKVGSRLYVGYT